MMAEHGKFNKNRIYRTSAGIPFILRYPAMVGAGKTIETSYTSVDFAPSLHNMLGITTTTTNKTNSADTTTFQGIDFSQELLSNEAVSSSDKIRYVFDSGKNMAWAAALMNQYRLVVSKGDAPFLFDLDKDPYELTNFYDDVDATTATSNVTQILRTSLLDAMVKFKMPLQSNNFPMYWDTPACKDSRDRLPTKAFAGTCKDLGESIPILNRCDKRLFQRHCPVTCNVCCDPNVNYDSSGEMWVSGELFTCDELKSANMCRRNAVGIFCPDTCNDQCNNADSKF